MDTCRTMKKHLFRTITGRTFDLDRLGADERDFLTRVRQRFETRPQWTAFGSWWVSQWQACSLPDDSPVWRICQDLEARLGIAQKKVAPPDYRDYLADLIEQEFGSRYKFCKATGVDPGQLSRVLAGKSELSIPVLSKMLGTLRASLVVQPEEDRQSDISPEEGSRALVFG